MSARPDSHWKPTEWKPTDLPVFERIVVWVLGGVGAIAATFAGLVAFSLWGGLGRPPERASSMLAAFLAAALLFFGVALFRLRQLRNGSTTLWSPRAFQGIGLLALVGGLLAVRHDAAEGLLRQTRDVAVFVIVSIALFRTAGFIRGLAATRNAPRA